MMFFVPPQHEARRGKKPLTVAANRLWPSCVRILHHEEYFMQSIRRTIESITPYKRNPRKIPRSSSKGGNVLQAIPPRLTDILT